MSAGLGGAGLGGTGLGGTGLGGTGLGGTGRVADDLYLMAHDDATGRPLLRPRGLGLGLAGALLADLTLEGFVGLRTDGTVMVGRSQAGEELAHRIQQQIAAEHRLPVREWLKFLALTASGDVAGRLERAGYLKRAGGRWPRRSRRRIPVNADWAFAPLIRVRSALDPARPWSVHGAVLAGLAAACGLEFRIEQYLTPGRSAAEVTGLLDPAVRELVAQTQAAVDSTVLSGRGRCP